MNVYLVTYNLNTKNKDYTKLYDELGSFDSWWHYLNNSWLILTPKTAPEILTKIKDYFGEDDRFLIIEVKKNFTGWLPKSAWDWISKYVP